MITRATVRAMERRIAQWKNCRGWPRNSLYTGLMKAAEDNQRLLEEIKELKGYQ